MTTLEHLEAWLEHEFPDQQDRDEIGPLMLDVYDADPEYWAGVGWRRLYDNVTDREVAK